MKGTHEIFISTPSGNAFITGVPDKCNHDDKAKFIELGNGDMLNWEDYLCPTDEATWEYIQKIASDRDTYISGGTVGCSKCGKPHSLKDIMGDAYWI